MQRFFGLDIPAGARGAVAAMGNFDGVHLGHQAVIDAARAVAAEEGAPLAVVTFEPHPRSVFAPDAPPFRLTTPDAKARRLERLGVNRLFEIPFDGALSALTPDAFARDVLKDALGLSHVVVGGDFHFGAKRAGDAAELEDLGRLLKFGVTVAQMVSLPGGGISSTRIREALSEGRPQDAARMLGHLHRIEGYVLHGEKRGRTLGFPTANLALEGLHLPAFGVYAVRVEVLTGPHAGRHDGAASLGVRPQYDGEVPNLETFLLDFEGDLYGERISVGLAHYIRPELRFDSEAAFVERMHEDVAEARRLLA